MMLKSKVVIITGAGRGIGRAIALAFAKSVVDVIVVSKTPSELEAVARPGGRSFPNAPLLAAQLHFTALCDPGVRKDTALRAPTRLIDVAQTIPFLIRTSWTTQTEGLVALDALVEDDTLVGGSSP